jgi:glycosyltransferase involved in cell wall biosynthesis
MTSHDIILVAAEPWEHCTWRRRHHVAWNLAKSHRVLFVEPPLTLFQPFRQINLNWRHLFNLGRLKYQGRNLYSYSPVRLLPLSLPGSELFNYYERDKKRTFNILIKIVRELKMKHPILWVYFSQFQYDYYGLFGERIRVTDWYDKFASYTGIELLPDQILSNKKREENIIKNSDVIFAVSKELGNDLRFSRKSVYAVPHGVDYESFKNMRKRENLVKEYVKRIKHPILGFIGIMYYKVDFELLNYIAEQRSEWSILLLGRRWLNNETDKKLFDELINKDSVHYLGEKPKEELPDYLSQMDVCLMPFKKIEFVKYMAPLKLLEYLAAGKPVVAVYRGVEYEFSEFIKVADSKEAFVKAIAHALEEDRQNGESLAEARKRIARQNSWGTRVNQMIDIIESHLNDLN